MQVEDFASKDRDGTELVSEHKVAARENTEQRVFLTNIHHLHETIRQYNLERYWLACYCGM